MRIFDSILIGSLLVASAACSKSPPAEGADAADAAAADAVAAPAKPADAPAAAATPPAPGGAAPAPAPGATEFPSKDVLVGLVEQVKVFEGQSKAGKLKPEELKAFMAESKQKFPPGVEPPRQLIEGDPQFKAAQEELMAVMKSINPADMQNPEKQKELEAKMTPITLKLMRRTFEVLIENDWKPPAPGAAPAPVPGAAPAPVPAPAPAPAPAAAPAPAK